MTPNNEMNYQLKEGGSKVEWKDLIKDVENSSLNREAKQKTIETLSAITGMLQSLRDKKILAQDCQSVERKSNNCLKKKFNVRIKY